MKSFICDICGASEKEYNFTTINVEYKTESIQHCCEECYKELSHILAQINRAISPIKVNWFKKTMAKLRDRKLK